jgi:hypothetical protein
LFLEDNIEVFPYSSIVTGGVGDGDFKETAPLKRPYIDCLPSDAREKGLPLSSEMLQLPPCEDE